MQRPIRCHDTAPHCALRHRHRLAAGHAAQLSTHSPGSLSGEAVAEGVRSRPARAPRTSSTISYQHRPICAEIAAQTRRCCEESSTCTGGGRAARTVGQTIGAGGQSLGRESACRERRRKTLLRARRFLYAARAPGPLAGPSAGQDAALTLSRCRPRRGPASRPDVQWPADRGKGGRHSG